jgi:hypothetical protein
MKKNLAANYDNPQKLNIITIKETEKLKQQLPTPR